VCKKNFDKYIEGLQMHLKSKEHEKKVKELKKHEAVGEAHRKSCEEYKRTQEKEKLESRNKVMCHGCSQMFKGKAALSSHVNRFHPTGGHKCKVCVRWSYFLHCWRLQCLRICSTTCKFLFYRFVRWVLPNGPS